MACAGARAIPTSLISIHRLFVATSEKAAVIAEAVSAASNRGQLAHARPNFRKASTRSTPRSLWPNEAILTGATRPGCSCPSCT
jgi:hypothetical protein